VQGAGYSELSEGARYPDMIRRALGQFLPDQKPCNKLQHHSCKTMRFCGRFTGSLKTWVCVVVVRLSCMFGVLL
jgi:hypothetical protein